MSEAIHTESCQRQLRWNVGHLDDCECACHSPFVALAEAATDDLRNKLARARASEKRLADAAALAASWAWDPDENQLEQFERIASEYYRDTGYLRPGKDDPFGDSSSKENRERWDAWRAQRSREVLRALRSALSESEGA